MTISAALNCANSSMSESTPAMHSEAASHADLACEVCSSPFRPRRGAWARARFCSTRCRNAFHGAERRKEPIRAAALDLFAALTLARAAIRGKDIEAIWINYPTEPAVTLGQRIDQVLGKLKPPVEPKDLLEKAKA